MAAGAFGSVSRVASMRQRRRPSRFQWICATAAPWALASGLLVSFTAAAGTDAGAGWSTAPLLQVEAASRLSLPAGPAGIVQGRRVALASLSPDLPVDIAIAESDGAHSPREGGKLRAVGFSPLQRAAKGAPLVAPQPSLSRAGIDAGLNQHRLGRLMFDGPAELAAPGFVPAGEMIDWPQNVFVPLTDGDGATRTVMGASSSSGSASGGGTGKPQIVSIDGATPATPRAVALSSATPAPADATPVEVAAAPVSLPEGGLMTARPAPDTRGTPGATPEQRPAYAALIDPQSMSKEQRCLAEAVYFEARSESEEGQAAVAQVVLNRVKSGLYPKTVCGVVYQNRHRYLGCQFSFACEGKSLRITEAASWNQAVRVAREVTEGKTYLADVGGATHYHADYVRPFWAKKLKKMDTIGRHIFYKLRPGQT